MKSQLQSKEIGTGYQGQYLILKSIGMGYVQKEGALSWFRNGIRGSESCP